MKFKITAAIVCLIMLAGNLAAEQAAAPTAAAPTKLTADEAVAFALGHNVGLMTENLKLAIAKRGNDFSWNKLMPTVSVSASLARMNVSTYSGLKPLSYTAPTTVMYYSQDVDPWTLGLNLTAQWSISVATIHSINQTAIDFQNSRISQETAQKRLERDIRKTFNSLLALQEALKLTERQIINAETRYKQALSSYNAGLTSNLQVLQAQVNWENKKPALEDQKLNYQQAMMGFAMSLGLDVQTPIVLDGSIKSGIPTKNIDANNLIAQHIDERLDIKALRGSVESLDNTIKLQESSRLPSLVVSYSADPTVSTLFDSSTDITKGDSWEQRSGMLMFMLRWQLDTLIPGLSTATAIDNLKDQKAQLQLGLDQAKTAAQMEIINLVNRIKKSADSLKTLALNVELAQQAYKQTDDAYRAGNQTLADVQDADVQQQAALFQVLNEQLTLANNLLDLEYALNTSKSDFLKGDKQ